MLQIPTWSRVLTLLVLLLGFIIALPNALPNSVLTRLPHWWPTNTVALGLDLQGGSYLLLEVELDQVQKDRLESLMGDIRSTLRKNHIAFTDVKFGSGSISLRILEPDRFDDAKSLIAALNPSINGSVLSAGAKGYELSEPAPGSITMTMTESYKTQTDQDILGQSIEVVRKRIDQLGTREPSIERQGDDRIVVQVPGLSDPAHLIALLGKTAKMTFQMVDSTASPEDAAQKHIVPIGSELLYQDNPVKGQPPIPVVVEKHVIVAGDRLVDAQQGFDPQSGLPDVEFRFDSLGAREFGEATKENVDRFFAIVLDNKVIENARIRDPILGGSGMITGGFTLESAKDLSVLLRAGALPAPLKVIEQRTVGAELGSDQINAGKFSTLAGLALVAIFMVLRYGLFGVFADVALTLNVVLLLALLTLLGATLTLPGIAGIVLTMGMAVDANVLIYERIREEIRNGRSIIASIDQGFRRAMATIFDANMTHLIASVILFQLGTGPVRGFAVALGLGIVTSFFTAVMVTRLMVVTWFQAARPKQLAI
jgi:protein-export membrane protein SecD